MIARISRIAALVLSIGYVIAAGLSKEGWRFAVWVAVGVLIPLALIWFPQAVDDIFLSANNRGLTSMPRSPSPAWLIAAMGWVLLAGIPLWVFLRG